MTKIIGFTGKMGSGKSTATEILTTNPYAHVEKFAGTLYKIHDYIYRKVSSVYNPGDTFVKDRKLLQWLGTEWGRSIDPDLWVKLWKSNVEFIMNSYSHISIIVADDVRFDNEAETVRSLGGVVVEIVSDLGLSRTTDSNLSGHPSEHGVSSSLVDVRIENNGSLEEFKEKILKLY